MKMKRVFLELNGEALAGPKKTGLDKGTVKEVARQAGPSVDIGIQVGTVTGGGNFWRGRTSEAIDRTKADQIGILAIAVNCTYVSEIFRNADMMTQILTLFKCGSMTKLFSKDRANKYSEKGMVVFLTDGTGHPYFSTDTGIALRTIGMKADCIPLTKVIDGVYNSDPKLNLEARKYGTASIQRVIDGQLVVMDLTASIMCMEYKMPMVIFNLNEGDEVTNTMQGRTNGTIATAQ